MVQENLQIVFEIQKKKKKTFFSYYEKLINILGFACIPSIC